MRSLIALALGFGLLSTASAAWSNPTVDNWIARNKATLLRDYVGLLAIPNVSGDAANIRRNAEYLVEMMGEHGLSPRLLEVDEPSAAPAVYGEWLVPGADRTLVFYAHYDGQPVSPKGWISPPFLPVLRDSDLSAEGKVIPLPAEGAAVDPNWRIYARSSSDNKAGVMAILAAIAALRANNQVPGFNLKIYFDGEEERSSPHLADSLEKHRELLRSDGWVIIDGPNHPTGATQVVLGVRGIVRADITVYGPLRPLHSGHYGNWAPNPAMMLSKLLASMKDESGRVTIAGFYDDMVPYNAAEREAIAAIPAMDEQLRYELAFSSNEGGGRKLADLISEPSLNIDGIRSADVGVDARAIVPTTATASLDLRLVKGNEPDRQLDRLVRHVQAQGYVVLDREPTLEERRSLAKIATIRRRSGYSAERTSIEDPLAKSVISAVKSQGPAVIVPSAGGSLPLHVIRKTMGVPNVTVTLTNHDSNQHAENENIRLGDLWQGIGVTAALLKMQ